MPTILRAGVCSILCLALLSCSFAPKYERPDQKLPSSWKNVQFDKDVLDADWWKRFNDPVLTKLIEEALVQNQSVEEYMGKVEAAAAQAGQSLASIWPSLGATGSATAQGASEKGANTVPFDRSGLSRSTTSYTGSLSAGWELDFWGVKRNTYTSLSNILLATAMSYEALRLDVSSKVAEGYFTMLSLDMKLEIAKRTLRTREEAFSIYTSRYKQGDITELDWQRAKAEVETARSQVHSTLIDLDKTEAALAVLLGRSPKDIIELKIVRGTTIKSLPTPPAIPAGLPSELLERRPDVRSAEYALIASNAEIGVARGLFFPNISLTGALGTLSASVANLFTGPAALWSYGVSANLPLLDGGQRWYNLKGAEARKKQAIAVYRKTVQTAFSDVRTALTAQTETREIVDAMQSQVNSLKRAAELARLQYDNGYTDYLTVLDAERQLFTAELSYATALCNRLNSIVGVCKAFGGGWRDPHTSVGYPPMNAEKLVNAARNPVMQ